MRGQWARTAKLTLLFAPLLFAGTLHAQDQPYVLSVKTEEVALNFHVEDAKGRSISDLAQADLRLKDNGKEPARVTMFSHHENLPLRMAIVFDESRSMQWWAWPRRVAQALTATAIQSDKDQALVARFDFETEIVQDWTSDPALLQRSAALVTRKNGSRLGGTAIWDTLYRVCRDHIPTQTPGSEVSANAILLFTDGVDNWSHARPQDVIDMCAARETPIYPFVLSDKEHFDKGQQALRELAERTGGAVLYEQASGESLTESIARINRELRDRYTLVYRPQKIKLDGSFHTVKLDAPGKPLRIFVRNGYFAEP